jgi:hypothetical protein
MAMWEIEGTWEAILARSSELAGQRVRVTVLDGVQNGQGAAMTASEPLAAALDAIEADDADMPFTPSGARQSESGAPAERFAASLREAEELEREMPLTPATDTVALIREARSGAMWGYEPAE